MERFHWSFDPPFSFRIPGLFPNPADTIRKNPYDYVGLITNSDHYQNKIRKTTELVEALSSRDSRFSRLTVSSVPLSRNNDFLLLQNEQVENLVEKYHAVRKKVEYEGRWKDKNLGQVIYPYAGKPLAQLCKNPQNAPAWPHFFKGMSEIAHFLMGLHNQGYVHGDLSPNNLLYNGTGQRDSEFTIVDWNLMSTAEDFLKQKKGRTRVGCWSPEHFSLTTTRLQDYENNRHWLIYSEEMAKYIERLLGFSFSAESSKGQTSLRKYFEPYSQETEHPVFQTMYKDLKILANEKPSAIGKYHDIRYFMDTIAKSVSGLFPNRTEAQQKQYNFFISLCLAQNLPDRKVYLETPDRLIHRLTLVLQACQKAEQKIPMQENMRPKVPVEQSLLDLLR